MSRDWLGDVPIFKKTKSCYFCLSLFFERRYFLLAAVFERVDTMRREYLAGIERATTEAAAISKNLQATVSRVDRHSTSTST
jgi:hypothetical protein